MPERVWLLPVSRTWVAFPTDKGEPYVPESRLLAAEARVREVEAERDALAHQLERRADGMDPLTKTLRADLAALAKVLERVVLAGRYINIAPPRNDDANRQSDHDEFYAANEAGEAAARAVLARQQEEA